jgi:hypothetical protein
MNKIMTLFTSLSVCILISAQSQDNFETKLLTQFHTIKSEEMMTWLEKLCSPEFNGSLTLNMTQADGSVIKKNYTYPEEYFPGMNSGSGEITAEVVFVGYGVSAPEPAE